MIPPVLNDIYLLAAAAGQTGTGWVPSLQLHQELTTHGEGDLERFLIQTSWLSRVITQRSSTGGGSSRGFNQPKTGFQLPSVPEEDDDVLFFFCFMEAH